MKLRALLASLLLGGLLALTSRAQIALPTVISDATFGPLQSGQEYIANSTVRVAAGTTQTVQPGAIVKFTGFGFMDIRGTLLASGTASMPIYFTSINDHTVGSATGSGMPAPGDWPVMQFGGSSDASVLEYCEVRFSGRPQFGGAISLSGADATFRHVTVSRSAADGIQIFAASFPTVDGCAFNDGGGVACDGLLLASVPGFTNNTASGNAGGDQIRVGVGPLPQPITIGPENGINGVIVATTDISITGSTLTLAAGLILKFQLASGLFINGSGQLVTQGTPGNPVVITERDDDAFGGDTFNDGPTTGTPGSWRGIKFFNAASASSLAGTHLRFAGSDADNAALTLNGAASPIVTRCVFEQSSGFGIKVNVSGPVAVTECDFRDNGLRPFSRTRWLTMEGFRDNTGSGNAGGNHIELVDVAPVGPATQINRYNTINGNGVIVVFGSIAVPNGGSLFLGPGLILKITRLIDVIGNLIMEGRGDAPIHVTSHADDSLGGDTNLDGAATQPAPGDWISIWFRVGGTPSGSLNNVHCHYGGATLSLVGQPTTIVCNDPDVRLTSIRVDRSAGDGIRVRQLQGVGANWVAWECAADGVELLDGTFEVQHITATRNGGAGVGGVPAYGGTVLNSIAWDNGAGVTDNFNGVRVRDSNGSPTGNNLLSDPLFVDPVAGDLHISPFSLSVGRANLVDALRWGVDYDGNSRVLDHALNGLALPDQGAYEVFQYRMDVAGEARLGTTMTFTTTGPGPQTPPGFQVVLGGPAVGGEFLPPFGVLITGTQLATSVLAVTPIGVPYSLAIPDLAALVGFRFAVQTAVFFDLSIPAGNLTNARLATVTL